MRSHGREEEIEGTNIRDIWIFRIFVEGQESERKRPNNFCKKGKERKREK